VQEPWPETPRLLGLLKLEGHLELAKDRLGGICYAVGGKCPRLHSGDRGTYGKRVSLDDSDTLDLPVLIDDDI
jgi:hypothetical protein